MAEQVSLKGYRIPKGLRATATDEERRKYGELGETLNELLAVRATLKPIYQLVKTNWESTEHFIDQTTEKLIAIEDGQQEMKV